MIQGRPATIELAGKPRMVLPGGCRYDTPPEPGTIMGPMFTREFVVVLGTNDEGLTLFSYAQTDDLAAAARAGRSMTEVMADRRTW